MFGPTAPGSGSVHTTVGAKALAVLASVGTPLLESQPASKTTISRENRYGRMKTSLKFNLLQERSKNNQLHTSHFLFRRGQRCNSPPRKLRGIVVRFLIWQKFWGMERPGARKNRNVWYEIEINIEHPLAQLRKNPQPTCRHCSAFSGTTSQMNVHTILCGRCRARTYDLCLVRASL